MKSQLVTVAVVQCELNDGRNENANKVMHLIADAAKAGANVVITPELFQTPYFCKEKRRQHFSEATKGRDHRQEFREGDDQRRDQGLLNEFCAMAESYRLVIPFSYFEDAGGGRFYNSVMMIDTDGKVLGRYRKSHIPCGPGYEERYYFQPGDTGFKVWKTKHGKIGVGICWDQWFPECARAMAMAGADMLLYPTTIGAEPHRPDLDTRDRWRRVMIGHAVANTIPIAAANRSGIEDGIRYYGSSFICDDAGEIKAEMARQSEGFTLATLDLVASRRNRRDWGLVDVHRRPDLYGALTKRR